MRCDNEAVVTVLRSCKTLDPYLATCACNIWYASATLDIDFQYAHVATYFISMTYFVLPDYVSYTVQSFIT